MDAATADWKVAGLFFGPCLLVCGIIIWIGAHEDQEIGKASMAYTKTHGAISHSFEYSARGGRASSLLYTYNVDGKTFESDRVSYDPYYRQRTQKLGEQVDVYYDQKNPKESCLVPGVEPFHIGFKSNVGLLMIFIGAILGFGSLAVVKKQS